MSQLLTDRLLLQALSGAMLALLLLMPLAVKWEIKLKTAAMGAVVFGLLSGLVSYLVDQLTPVATVTQFALQGSSTLALAFIAAALMFYRDPERVAASGEGDIVSPADGTILYIKRIDGGEVPLSTKKGRSFRIDELAQTSVLNEGAYLVGIGMNLLNVHVNRAPINGIVELINPVRGSFLSLKADDALLQNERCTTVISNGVYRVGVIQIASRLVRRIESYIEKGQEIGKGERIGMIRFGSQVDLVLPLLDGLEVAARVGDEVRAGESVIAQLGVERSMQTARRKPRFDNPARDMKTGNNQPQQQSRNGTRRVA